MRATAMINLMITAFIDLVGAAKTVREYLMWLSIVVTDVLGVTRRPFRIGGFECRLLDADSEFTRRAMFFFLTRSDEKTVGDLISLSRREAVSVVISCTATEKSGDVREITEIALDLRNKRFSARRASPLVEAARIPLGVVEMENILKKCASVE